MVAAALVGVGTPLRHLVRGDYGQVPAFHPEVRVWEVKDTASGAHRGLFYMDNFARAGKRSGAWASSYRPQHTFDGRATAITSNNEVAERPRQEG